MARAWLLSCMVVAALLLSGCTSEPKPEEGLQGAIVGSAEEMIGVTEPARPAEPAAPAQQINCTLAARPGSVLAGGQVQIVLNASFSGSAAFDLYCGNDARRLYAENGLDLETSCRFDEPGKIRISVSANGKECAAADVEVKG